MSQQVVQDVRHGRSEIRMLPDPMAMPGTVVIANAVSLISAGTERYVVQLAKSNLLLKARQRPDHVRRILQKIRNEGLLSTIQQVRAKLEEPMPLGYSAAGIVIECGRGVSEFKPGDRVAAAAPHASVAMIGHNLVALMPDTITFEQAAYAGVGAVALQGVRLARTGLGERVLVIGLGLIGLITVALLKAQGIAVFGIDLSDSRCAQAKAFGAEEVAQGWPSERITAFTAGAGVDAVIITAATDSNEPIEFAAAACRHKGRIVLVGVVGLNIPRPPFYQKELEFTVSSSLGAGRGDMLYEEKGIDYPIGYARWTVQRNMEAVLGVMASGAIPVERLTTHRFAVENADQAYELISSGKEPYTGVLISYADDPPAMRRRIDFSSAERTFQPATPSAGLGISVIGAGNFGRLVMLPKLAKRKDVCLRGMCTARGLHAEDTGRSYGFSFATTEEREVLSDPRTNAVLILTRHDLHAEQVIRSLRAGKHVFVEKPLCITPAELRAIGECVQELGQACPILMVGFNRRFSSSTRRIREWFKDIAPMNVTYRFVCGTMPAATWPQDEELGGGRIIGEACHAIDTCCAIVGATPVRVFAESIRHTGSFQTSDDQVSITLRHANGSICSILYTSAGDRGASTERIEVFGAGRTGIIDGWDRTERWYGGSRRVSFGHRDKGHSSELQAFVNACKDGGEWPIPWEDIVGTSWAAIGAVQSLRSGLPIAESGLEDITEAPAEE